MNVIESKSVPKSHSKVNKSVCKPVAASSNLTVSQGGGGGGLTYKKNCQIYKLCVMIDLFKSKLGIAQKELSGLNKKRY